MTQQELDTIIKRKNACKDTKQYTWLCKNLKYNSRFNPANIEEARTLIIDRAKEMEKFFNNEKLYDYYMELDIHLDDDWFYDMIPKAINKMLVDDEENLATLCLICAAFKQVGTRINIVLAYIIWTDYVSEAYCAQWLGCINIDGIWEDILIHFLFEDWS